MPDTSSRDAANRHIQGAERKLDASAEVARHVIGGHEQIGPV